MNNRHDDVPLLTEFDSCAIVRARYDPEDRALDIWYKGGDRIQRRTASRTEKWTLKQVAIA